MNSRQEPKYKIVGTGDDAKLANRHSGDVIPDDEPVFVLRARDKGAAAAIAHYLMIVSKGADFDHMQAVIRRLLQFRKWSEDHPERMKQPDTVLTRDWEGL